MKVGVDPGAVGGLEFVDEGVRGGPVAVGVEPEGVEGCWERGGFRGRECAEDGGGHGVIMRVAA